MILSQSQFFQAVGMLSVGVVLSTGTKLDDVVVAKWPNGTIIIAKTGCDVERYPNQPEFKRAYMG
jgi:hypothetical protein